MRHLATGVMPNGRRPPSSDVVTTRHTGGDNIEQDLITPRHEWQAQTGVVATSASMTPVDCLNDSSRPLVDRSNEWRVFGCAFAVGTGS